MNVFEGEQPDSEDEDDDFYDPSMFTFIPQGTNWTQAQQTHTDQVTPTINTFAALETEDNDFEIENALEQLNGWAHRINMTKQKSLQKSRRERSSLVRPTFVQSTRILSQVFLGLVKLWPRR